MSGCCDPGSYKGVFSEREARRSARAFNKRGLDSTAGPMIGALASGGLEGASVLEVGAGVGTAQVALIKSGAERSVAVDISPAYRKEAEALLTANAVRDRVELVVGDIVADEGEIQGADVVFLNKVLCCYPDGPGLIEAVTRRASDRLAMSFPRKRLFVRAVLRLINFGQWVRRSSFRVFLHDPASIRRQVESTGMHEVAGGETPVWEWHVWERRTT